MSRWRWLLWLAATLVVALLVHVVTMYELPRFMMAQALERMGAPNEMHFARRPDEDSRAVVRPSPDLLYAACPFDLSKAPLVLRAPVPHSTYWSISAFDDATNNFFALNDRQVAGDAVEIVVLRPGMAPPSDASPERVTLEAPTETGLILLRVLVDDERHLPAIDNLRREATCETAGAPDASDAPE